MDSMGLCDDRSQVQFPPGNIPTMKPSIILQQSSLICSFYSVLQWWNPTNTLRTFARSIYGSMFIFSTELAFRKPTGTTVRIRMLWDQFNSNQSMNTDSTHCLAVKNIDSQCIVQCKSITSDRLYYGIDVFEDGIFPAGTPCVAEGRTRGYCLYGKCIAEDKFGVSLHRITQQGSTLDYSTEYGECFPK